MPTYAEQNEWAALAAYANDGDPDAFEVLVHRYQAMVYATCRRQLNNASDAEDATQETFLKLARKAGSIRSSLSAWLHTCAVGTSKDLIRSRVTRRKHEQEAGKAIAPDRDATWDQLGPVIDDALQSLQTKERDLIVERYLMGVAQTQIAEREGVSPSAIHQRVDRAVEKLRRKLRSRGLQVAAVALGTMMTGVAEASVPQAVTASAMKIGVSGVGAGQSGSAISSIVHTILEASLMTKITATAAALTLAAGTTVTINQLNSATPTTPAPPAPAAAPATTTLAQDPVKALEGTWENRSFKMDNEPAMGASIDGRVIKMFVPPMMPGAANIEMTLEIIETDPDAKPGKIVYKILGTNNPMIPITGDAIEASYMADDSELTIAFNLMGNERPADLEHAPGRGILSCFKDTESGEDARMDDGLDPALAGEWTGYIPVLLEMKDGVSYVKTPNGDIINESELISFDKDAKPMRMTYIIISAIDQPEMVGETMRYLVDIKGDRAIFAGYELHSPKKGQWPRDFKGRKGDMLTTTIWQRVEEQD